MAELDLGRVVGTDGVTPDITATASVDANSGTPSVTVTKTGTDEAPNFDFAFHNLKPDSGDTAEHRYNVVTKSTGNYDAAITVKKYINDVLDTSTDYLYTSLTTPVNFDGHFTIGYANTRYTFTLLDNSTTHTAGYTEQWLYNASVDFSETFIVDMVDLSYIAPAFATSVSYVVGDIVTHEGKLFRCTTAHSAGTWNASHFTETTVDASFVDKTGDTMTGALTVQGNITSTGSITDGSGNVLSNKAENTQTFTEASTRANIDTGETMPTLFGKIKKWFADLADLAFISKDGTSSTKYLRGDGTWQAFPNYAGSSSQGGAANSVVQNLYVYDGTNQSFGFNGSAEKTIYFRSRLYEVTASSWSATTDSDGYYTNTVNLGVYYNTHNQPFVSCIGSTKSTVPTAAQKAAFSLCDVFYFADTTMCNSMTVKAKTKPTETFYVMVNGIYVA